MPGAPRAGPAWEGWGGNSRPLSPTVPQPQKPRQQLPRLLFSLAPASPVGILFPTKDFLASALSCAGSVWWDKEVPYAPTVSGSWRVGGCVEAGAICDPRRSTFSAARQGSPLEMTERQWPRYPAVRHEIGNGEKLPIAQAYVERNRIFWIMN